MLPSQSIDLTAPALQPGERQQLLSLARAAISRGPQDSPPIALHTLPASLQCARAVFVTLTLKGSLRGCIGSLEASAPLALAVVDAARGAAYRDPRFPPLRGDELDAIHIEISVLSELAEIAVASRKALLATLRPGEDGLLLEDGPCRSTFLPQVWSQLPEARDFLAQLMLKAGLPAEHWSPSLRAYRYTVTEFEEERECSRA